MQCRVLVVLSLIAPARPITCRLTILNLSTGTGVVGLVLIEGVILNITTVDPPTWLSLLTVCKPVCNPFRKSARRCSMCYASSKLLLCYLPDRSVILAAQGSLIRIVAIVCPLAAAEVARDVVALSVALPRALRATRRLRADTEAMADRLKVKLKQKPYSRHGLSLVPGTKKQCLKVLRLFSHVRRPLLLGTAVT